MSKTKWAPNLDTISTTSASPLFSDAMRTVRPEAVKLPPRHIRPCSPSTDPSCREECWTDLLDDESGEDRCDSADSNEDGTESRDSADAAVAVFLPCASHATTQFVHCSQGLVIGPPLAHHSSHASREAANAAITALSESLWCQYLPVDEI